MALEKQNIPLSLSGGIDTKTDPKQVISGKLLRLENGVFTSLKRIKKRNGYSALPNLVEGSTLLNTFGAPLYLGNAANFGLLASTGITSTGVTTIAQNMGESPGNTISQSPAIVVRGSTHLGDSTSAAALVDLTIAYNTLRSQATTTNLSGTNLGGLTLTAGVYNFSTVAVLTGVLTLDAQNNPNAVWIFKVGTTFTASNSASISIINGGYSNNIYFVSGATTTIGTSTVLSGNFIANTNITVGSGSVINGRLFSKTGTITITMTEVNSYSPFTTTNSPLSPISSGVALANFKNETVLLTNNEAYSFSQGTQRWTDKGALTPVELTVKPVARNTYQQTTCDSCYHPSGLECFTWNDSRGGARYSIIDSSSGDIVVADSLIGANATKAKPFALGAYIGILYYDTTSHNLVLLPLRVTNPSIPLATVTVSTTIKSANPNFDAVSDGTTRIYVTFNTSGGGITLKYINQFLSASAALVVGSDNADSCIGVGFDNENQHVWVAYHNGTQINYFIRDRALSSTAVLATTLIEANSNTINNICLYPKSGNADVFYTQNAAATYNNFIKHAINTNAGVNISLTTMIRSVGISGKPFWFNNRVYLPVAYQTSLQPSYFILDTSTIKVIAKFAPQLGGGLLATSAVPETVSTGGNTFLLAFLQKDLLSSVSGSVFTQTGVMAATLDFSEPEPMKVELGENLHVSGGILHMYDGVNVVEHSYHMFPENVTCSTSTLGGNLAAGTYQYAIVYEWTDNQGQIHYSAPSVPTSQVTTGATSTNTLTISTLRVTNKANVSVAIYRTEKDQTIFYRISSLTSPLANVTSSDTVQYIDTAADSTIIGNQLLYTTGSVIENIAAPACSFITTFKDRVILLPSENSNQWWFSKQLVPGVPVEFTDSFVKNVDQQGGKLVAAARMDTELILLKENQLYYVTGQGPDSTGSQDDFSEAQSIPCDGGCTDKRSVILTPSGLMYKSQKGIYLLARNLEPKYIGAEVEAYNSNHIVSATLISDTTQVRFCLDSGVALVYDYLANQWSVFTKHSAVDSGIFSNLFTFLTPEGQVMQETPGIYSDNGNFISLRLTTAWLSFAGLQEFQRVYKMLLLGEYFTAHNLNVKVAYDFNPYFVQEPVILVGELLSSNVYGDDATYGDSSPYGGAFPLYQFRVNLSRQKCSSIQFDISDTPTTSDMAGEGVALSAIAFEVGVKKGLNKLPATNAAGST